jgi:polar amino acid transport system ATP-binding protein
MIRIRNLHHTYPGGTAALAGIDLDLASGDVRAIVGRSGSGKTTLLMCLAGFLQPSAGSIELDGDLLGAIPEAELRRRLGVVFQGFHLFPHLDVLDNLVLAPTRTRGIDPVTARQAARVSLARLGLADLEAAYPQQLSGGQAQRVAIARALLLQPRYLLLDEPTSALDHRSTSELAQWLRDLREETTFIVVTHDAGFAGEVATTAVAMADGQVIAEGDVATALAAL